MAAVEIKLGDYEDELLDVKEVAKMLGISHNHTYQMALAKRIPSKKILGKRRFLKSEIIGWIKRQKA